MSEYLIQYFTQRLTTILPSFFSVYELRLNARFGSRERKPDLDPRSKKRGRELDP